MEDNAHDPGDELLINRVPVLTLRFTARQRRQSAELSSRVSLESANRTMCGDCDLVPGNGTIRLSDKMSL
jgi:hypothetical protein